MTNDQKERVQWHLALERRELQQLEAGQRPPWAVRPDRPQEIPLDLNRRCTYAEWCLKRVLIALLPTLPADLRTAVQACLDLREHIWSREYMNAYYAQKETSPECLAASEDSL
jgi:hypothetical protein